MSRTANSTPAKEDSRRGSVLQRLQSKLTAGESDADPEVDPYLPDGTDFLLGAGQVIHPFPTNDHLLCIVTW